eukprot:6459605-Amphidinium_carterae.1
MKLTRVEADPSVLDVQLHSQQSSLIATGTDLWRGILNSSIATHPEMPSFVLSQSKQIAVAHIVEVLMERENVVLVEIDT